MAYETKVILIALSEFLREAKEEKAYRIVQKMANAEGVILENYDSTKDEDGKAPKA